jgi:hypothetical protein
MIKQLLKLWVRLKCWYAKCRGWIGCLQAEKYYIDRYIDDIDVALSKIKYTQDKISNVQWDHQYDAKYVWQKKKGDCNSIHRLVQIYYFQKGYWAWLCTYIAKPFKKSHSFVIIKENGKYFGINYSDITRKRRTAREVVRDIARLYDSKAIAYCYQDEHWRLYNEI